MENIAGKRVMIVEDNALIGEILADTVVNAGGAAIGPCANQKEAFEALEFSIDAAILDVHLDGTTFGVAARLRQLGIPFVFATGHGGDVPQEFDDIEICEKPYTINRLLKVLDNAITRGRH